MNATVTYQTETLAQVFNVPLPDGATSYDNEQVLNYVYRQCNHVEGNEWIADKKLRSMMIGDMVEVRGTKYICEPVGWKKVGYL